MKPIYEIDVVALSGSGGGVGILVKKYLTSIFDISIFDKSLDGILGIKFKHKCDGFTFVIYVCYLPPESSNYERDSLIFFSHLSSQIYILDRIDMILLCGDFNAKLGTLSDCIDGDNVIPRKVCDCAKNMHGEALIEFLHETKMCVLNGHISPENNDYTFISSRGKSVVDYIITEHNTLSYCQKFNMKLLISLI